MSGLLARNRVFRTLRHAAVGCSGQLPAILTPYIVKSMYRNLGYTNAALTGIGWTQRISTAQGIDELMTALKKPKR